MSAWANVATIGKAKNLKGGLLVYAREGLPFLLEEGIEVTFVPPVLRVPRTGRVISIAPQGQGAHLVFFDTIDSIDLAEKLQDHSCLVLKRDLPEDYDRGLLDLVDFALLDADERTIGRIVALEENPAHPLLVVELEDAAGTSDMSIDTEEETAKLVRVPLVEEFIIDIDEGEATIEMNLPEGLLDI